MIIILNKSPKKMFLKIPFISNKYVKNSKIDGVLHPKRQKFTNTLEKYRNIIFH